MGSVAKNYIKELKKKMAKKINNHKCRTCLYRLDTHGLKTTICCGYLYYTGHMRGCDGGADCVKYVRSTASERKRLTEESKRETIYKK